MAFNFNTFGGEDPMQLQLQNRPDFSKYAKPGALLSSDAPRLQQQAMPSKGGGMAELLALMGGNDKKTWKDMSGIEKAGGLLSTIGEALNTMNAYSGGPSSEGSQRMIALKEAREKEKQAYQLGIAKLMQEMFQPKSNWGKMMQDFGITDPKQIAELIKGSKYPSQVTQNPFGNLFNNLNNNPEPTTTPTTPSFSKVNSQEDVDSLFNIANPNANSTPITMPNQSVANTENMAMPDFSSFMPDISKYIPSTGSYVGEYDDSELNDALTDPDKFDSFIGR